MKSSKDQIREILTKQNNYTSLNFVNELECNKVDGMCFEYSNNNKNLYQYLPNPLPKQKADFIFICKEPSAGWASSSEDAFNKVNSKGYMNFISGFMKKDEFGNYTKNITGDYVINALAGIDIMILAFISVFDNQSIYLTDMSKCAMSTKDADELKKKDKEGKLLKHRYECCAPFLKWELENLASKDKRIFFVGKNYFFDDWKKKNSISMEKQLTPEMVFLKNIVKYETSKINFLPHYAIQFSCPEYMLRLLEDKTKIENAKIKIKEGVLVLLDYYLANFELSNSIQDDINQSKSTLSDKIDKLKITNSHILLYLIYVNEFKNSKNNKNIS